MLLLPTPVRQTAHGYSPELCKRSRPVPQIMTFVFLAFTLNLFVSMASFHIKILLTHSSRESAMMTNHPHIGPPREHQPETRVTRPPVLWWRARDWVWIPGGLRPSPQTLCWNPCQHEALRKQGVEEWIVRLVQWMYASRVSVHSLD